MMFVEVGAGVAAAGGKRDYWSGAWGVGLPAATHSL